MKEILFSDIAAKLPSFTQEERWKIWLGVTSLNRRAQEAMALLNAHEDSDFKTLQKSLFTSNIARAKEYFLPGEPCVGVWWRPGCFGSQLAPIARTLNAFQKYSYVAIVSDSYLEESAESKREDFAWGPYLAIPAPEDMSALTFLSAIIFSEDYIWQTYLPKEVVRIAQPHGMDVSFDATIKRYGGPIVFNYIFSPMREPYPRNEPYLGSFPSSLLEHDSQEICVIPGGYPKLDDFVQKCQASPRKKKIIYHLSVMGLESPNVRSSIGRTISLLMKSFPDREILFRPDPRDRNNTELRKQIAPFENNPQLSVSTASSYVDDYADAELLVTHRLETAHTFTLASGRPIVALRRSRHLSLPRRAKKTLVGYEVFSERQLISVVRRILEHPDEEVSRIQACSSAAIPNPGTAATYLVENLDIILEREKHPGWRYFRLYDDDTDEDGASSARNSLDRALKDGKPGEYICLAEAAATKYSDDARIHYQASLLNARFTNAFEHNIYFKFWYRAVYHLSKTLELAHRDGNLFQEAHGYMNSHGIPMALGVKWHTARHHAKYAEDINDILDHFNLLDEKGAFYRNRVFKTAFIAKARMAFLQRMKNLGRLPLRKWRKM